MALKLKQKMLGGRRNSVDARRLCAFDVSSAFQRVKYLCLIQKKKKLLITAQDKTPITFSLHQELTIVTGKQ